MLEYLNYNHAAILALYVQADLQRWTGSLAPSQFLSLQYLGAFLEAYQFFHNEHPDDDLMWEECNCGESMCEHRRNLVRELGLSSAFLSIKPACMERLLKTDPLLQQVILVGRSVTKCTLEGVGIHPFQVIQTLTAFLPYTMYALISFSYDPAHPTTLFWKQD